jgi:hypothetical protein
MTLLLFLLPRLPYSVRMPGCSKRAKHRLDLCGSKAPGAARLRLGYGLPAPHMFLDSCRCIALCGRYLAPPFSIPLPETALDLDGMIPAALSEMPSLTCEHLPLFTLDYQCIFVEALPSTINGHCS